MARILGIDYGRVRIGLALSDPLQIIASPFKTVIAKDTNTAIAQITRIVQEQDVESIVVGVPISLAGKITEQTKKVHEFIAVLKEEVKLPVLEAEERLSSVEASRILHQKGIKTGHHKAEVDKTAAAIILQTYLDSQK